MDRRILLVDDDQVLLKTLERMFTLFNVESVAVDRAEKAIQRLSQQPDHFPVALVDLGLPDMPGDELVGRLTDITSDLEIHIISGFGEGPRVRSAMDKGASGYLSKPFRIKTIEEFVEKVFPS